MAIYMDICFFLALNGDLYAFFLHLMGFHGDLYGYMFFIGIKWRFICFFLHLMGFHGDLCGICWHLMVFYGDLYGFFGIEWGFMVIYMGFR